MEWHNLPQKRITKTRRAGNSSKILRLTQGAVMSAHEKAVEAREIIGRLQTGQFSDLVRTLADNPDCYTAKGRVNQSAVARAMGISTKQVREMFGDVRATFTGCV
jgi:hypothetical protein